MKFDKKDRVLLINQYRILAALYPDEASGYLELVEILQSGYEIFYTQIHEWVSEDMSTEECKLVLDILSIYRIVEDYKRSNPSDDISKHMYSFFRGFDGNNETEYMGFARFLINEQGKFSEQQPYLAKNDTLNSHAPMINKYRNMVNKWQELGRKYQLNKQEILHILES
jgi:uncharacterized protein